MPGDVGPFRKLFPEEHIRYILSAIFRADLRKASEKEWENPITERLYDELEWLPRFRDGPLAICLRPKVRSSNSKTEKKVVGEPDILIFCALGTQVYFAIEAKRLRFRYPRGAFETGNSEYMGEDGMMRFVTGKYAPFMKAGAMLGYVFDGDIQEAWTDIAELIRKKTETLRMVDPKKLFPSEILPGERIGETHHLRMDDRAFTIYHVFMPL
uniref:Uncharacterized protein n=1 Tax=Candidatus Kentrum sp. FW TaxID=2126338 RepID=A0A450SH32_9GAMM|nr:MAG: hypothetical protein BECKFW1821B_GA0114236_101218 [Candidatus Kentron sp. FW]